MFTINDDDKSINESADIVRVNNTRLATFDDNTSTVASNLDVHLAFEIQLDHTSSYTTKSV